MSGKNESLLKCQGNVREFYNFQLVSNDEKQKMACVVFLTFWIQAKSFWWLLNCLKHRKMEGFGTLCLFSCLFSSLEPKVLLVWQLSGVLHRSVSSSVIIPPANFVCGGVYYFQVVRVSVRNVLFS